MSALGGAQAPRTFAGYVLLDRLGEGTFGEVHRAREPGGREVALKVLRPEVVDADMRARFDREARVGMSVDHPRVVRTLAAGEHEGRLYLVTELVPGGCLAGLLKRVGTLDEVRAAARTRELLEALEALHARRLVHRDVKPSNLLLGGDGRARLADLGLARSVERTRTMLTREGMILGTPATMAPEQVQGVGDLDIRCDLYAAGCVLFMTLCGRAPFVGKSALDIVRGHVQRPAPDVRSLRAEVSPALADVVRRLLEKDRARRPRDPAEALRLLDAAVPPEGARVDDATASPRAFPGTLPDAPAAPRAVPLTIPDAPAAPRAVPLTIPDAPAAPRAVPLTLPDAPAAPRAVPLTIPDAPAGGLPLTVPEAGPPVALTRDAGGPGLARARLTWTGPDGLARHLFVLGGGVARGGRDGLERADQDLCLRLLPSQAHADANRRISGQHVGLEVDADGAWVTDLGSTGGTWLDGARLSAGARGRIGPRARLVLAQALTLEARVLPPEGPRRRVDDDEVDAASPALLLTRPDNAPTHAYLLLPGACGLALDAAGVRPTARADHGLVWAQGALWAGAGPWPRWHLRPLVAGTTLDLAGATVSVSVISPRDQKE